MSQIPPETNPLRTRFLLPLMGLLAASAGQFNGNSSNSSVPSEPNPVQEVIYSGIRSGLRELHRTFPETVTVQDTITQPDRAISATQESLDLRTAKVQKQIFEQRALELQTLVEKHRAKLEEMKAPLLPAPGLSLDELMKLWYNTRSPNDPNLFMRSATKTQKPDEQSIFGEKPGFNKLWQLILRLEKSSSK